MKPITALCFVASGLALTVRVVAAPGAAGRLRRAVSVGLATLVAVLAWVALLQHLAGWSGHLDRLLYLSLATDALADPGRMSVASSAAFLLTGLSLLILAAPRGAGASQSMAASVLVIALAGALAYAFGADLRAVAPFAQVAPHTTVALIVLAFGILLARSREGWVAQFCQLGNSGRMGRRTLLATAIVLPALAQLRIIGERDLHLYGTYFGITLLTVGGAVVLITLAWFNTRAGNAADLRVERLNRTHAMLSGISNLVVRVRERELLFEEACRIAHVSGGFALAWVATVDPRTATATLAAWRGKELLLPACIDTRRLVDGPVEAAPESALREVCRTKQPVVCQPQAAAADGARGAQACALLPIVVDDTVAAVFALHAAQPGVFDTEEMALLGSVASDRTLAYTNLREAEQLNRLAYFDPITGLANRTLFVDRVNRAMQADSGQEMVVVLMDVNRFRLVNESFGRGGGDEALRQVADRLRSVLQWPENLARLNADCFATFVPRARHMEVAHRMEVLLERMLRQPFVVIGQDVRLDMVLGAAIHPRDGNDADTLIGHAEEALKRAKAAAVPFLFHEARVNARVAESLRLESQLREALELGQFVLHYQPQFGRSGHAVEGVEALLRWQHPELGLLAPDRFLGILEATGMIRKVGAWALNQAVADVGRWRAMGLQAPRVAVNVSALQLRDKAFVGTVIDAMAGFGDTEPLLDIEITEGAIMEEYTHTNAMLDTLHGVGVRVAVDDFGTGHSSLARLARLSIDTLKIDRSFVQGMAGGADGVTIVASIISLAHSLKLHVVAEGVETMDQALQLRKLGCDVMQGFLFSKAVSFDAVARLLEPVGMSRPAVLACDGMPRALERLMAGVSGGGAVTGGQAQDETPPYADWMLPRYMPGVAARQRATPRLGSSKASQAPTVAA